MKAGRHDRCVHRLSIVLDDPLRVPPEQMMSIAESGLSASPFTWNSSDDVPVNFRDGRLMLGQILDEQPDLSAVDRFSQFHEKVQTPIQGRYYSALMPASPPKSGQQLAFEVDLDRCTGCKACVSACHSLNGLDDGETWRDVGMIVSGSVGLPILQHVTTACHHCVEPACLAACPTEAYEKDPITGIVRHLDDQCFGCQYCALACPYDVPKYHSAKGIVRKCDMCSGRLKAGEAPACVQACPCEAIAIRVVDIASVVESAKAKVFLPTAPLPDYTVPSTIYKTNRPMGEFLQAADHHQLLHEHAHLPLVAMLVLTQASVGGYVVDLAVRMAGTNIILPLSIHSIFSFFIGQLGLAAATLHLGRPLYAYRAFLGFRHSWLSREVIAFSLFAGGSAGLTGLLALQPSVINVLPGSVQNLVRQVIGLMPSIVRKPLIEAIGLAGPGLFGLQMTLTVTLLGLMGVGTSMMVYQVCRRPSWRGWITSSKFFGSTLVLGLASWVASEAWSRVVEGSGAGSRPGSVAFVSALVASVFLKIGFEVFLLKALMDRELTPMRKSALIITGPLAKVWWSRCGLALIGGLGGGAVLIAPAFGVSMAPIAQAVFWSTVFAVLLVGELLERGLFFAAVVRLKMPGR